MSEPTAFETASLRLPLLAGEQAQKHVTVNEALAALDALVQLSVESRTLAAPPAAPDEGDRFIVAANPTGAWLTQAGRIAAWQDGAWSFHQPLEGWLAWVGDEDGFFVFDGTAWVSFAGSELQNLTLLGLGTAADAANRFAAKLNKALWTARTQAEGGDGDLRFTMNKESAADVLSLLLQSGFSGRAEIGLTGDDNLSVKVSADGAAWTTAMTVNRASGFMSTAGGFSVDPVNHDFYVDDVNGRVLMGASAARTNICALNGTPSTPSLQKIGTNSPAGSFGFCVDNNNATIHPVFHFARGRAAGTALGATDVLGTVGFNGSDGTNYLMGAAIRAAVDGAAPSANSLAAYLAFFSNDGSASPTERLRITRDGALTHRGNTQVLFDAGSHLHLRSYTVAALPSPSPAAQLVFVSNGTANKRLAVSDGAAWRFPDGSVVS